MISGRHLSGSIRFGWPSMRISGSTWTRRIRTSMANRPPFHGPSSPMPCRVRQHGFHLCRALQNPRRGDGERSERRQSRSLELSRLVAIAPGTLALRDRIAPGQAREPIHRGNVVDRRQVEDARAGAEEVFGGPGIGRQPEHAAPAEPPGRGHGRKVRGTILVLGADKDDGRTEIEDGRFDTDAITRHVASPQGLRPED